MNVRRVCIVKYNNDNICTSINNIVGWPIMRYMNIGQVRTNDLNIHVNIYIITTIRSFSAFPERRDALETDNLKLFEVNRNI